jgi:hypothetical protein
MSSSHASTRLFQLQLQILHVLPHQLAFAGLDVDDEALMEKIKHIQFEGLDKDMTTCYGGSIPAHKVR